MSDLTPSRPLNVAVIGCGMLARAQHIPNIGRCPDTRLHTCCDLDEGVLRALQSQHPGLKTTTDFRVAVADPEVDLLLVATTEHFRIPIFEAAVAARKPVYTEKPMAASLAEARYVRDIVTAAGLPFCVGHNRRCSPAMAEARAIYRQHMASARSCPWRYQRPGWEYVRDLVGDEEEQPAVSIRVNDDWMSWKPVHMQGANAEYGLLLSEMTHFADLACWFADAKPRRVGVLSSGVLNHATTIEFEGGGIASIFMAASGTFAYPKELLEAFGRGGTVIVDHMIEVRTAGVADAPERTTYSLLNDPHPDVGTQGGLAGWLEKRHAAREASQRAGNADWIVAAEPDKGHARMLGAFVEEIRGRRAVPVSPAATAVQAIEICAAAIRSFREKRFVDFAELDEAK
jgi:predicted dehydrogenase